jgi:hypothetical protein
MQAAGYGGYGTAIQKRRSLDMMVCRSMSVSFEEASLGGDYGRLNTPSVWRTSRTQSAAKVDGMSSNGMDDIEIPAFLRKQADSSDASLVSQMVSKVNDWVAPNKPHQSTVLTNADRTLKPAPSEASREDMAMALNKASLQASSFRIALQQTLKLNMPSNYAAVIIELTKLTKDSATSWALLFEWLFGDIEQSELLDRHAQRLLRSQLKLASDDVRERSKERFESTLLVN